MCALRIAHVVLSLEVGGLERVVLDLVREEATAGSDVAVLCIERPGTLAPTAESLGAKVVCLGKGAGLRPGIVLQAASFLRTWRPDIVHTHQLGALLYGGIGAWRARVPVVVHTEHGRHYSRGIRQRYLARIASRFAHRFFCVSRDIAAGVCKAGMARESCTFVVSNGINVDAFRNCGEGSKVRSELGIPYDAKVVGTVGRLNDVKRQDLLIRGFKFVRDKVPDAHLLLVGDGPSRGALEELVAELNLRQAVSFAGYQKEPQRFLSAMDVFALTSRSEGMPLSVLEAFAAGVPVVAFAVGGLPEIIDNGLTGFLCTFGDLPAFASLLVDVLLRPSIARQICEAAKSRAETDFSTAAMSETYHRHYLELLQIAAA